MAFWIPWVIDALAAAVLACFFFWGIADGTVSSFNITLWMGMLAVAFGIVGGSFWLRSHGRRGPAIALAWIAAVPVLLVFCLFAAMVILRPDFK